VPARTDDALWAQLRGLNERFKNWRLKSEARDKISKASARDPKEERAAVKKEQAVVKKEFVTLRKDLATLKASVKRHREASEAEGGSEIGKRPRVQEDLETTVDDLLRNLKDAEILEMFVRQVVQGITALKDQPNDRIQSTEDLLSRFVEYRQQHEQDNDGKKLKCVLENAAEAAESCAKTGFVCRFVYHLVEHLHRRQNPTYSRTGNCDRENEAKRSDLVPIVICRIVNGLRKHKGAEALVVLNALVSK
jgi:hypothetical protein